MKRIAFLHVDPRPGNISHNVSQLERGMREAARTGANWVITPELATTGYTFHEQYGTDWIGDEHDTKLAYITSLASDLDLTIFLGVPLRDEDGCRLFNALKVIDRAHGYIGAHRKINTLSVGSESWSTPGTHIATLPLAEFGIVGLLVCADACLPDLAAQFKAKDTKAIISSANWFPGELGPCGEWETISRETNVPVFVCNRTGVESRLTFSKAESVVAYGGDRIISVSSTEPVMILVDWDFSSNCMIGWSSVPI